MSREKTIYAFYGHPKCSSTWLSGLCLGICIDLGLKYYYKQAVLIEDVEKVINQGYRFFISQNSCIDKIPRTQKLRAFHFIRDPRDILVSGYYSYLNTHDVQSWEALRNLREELKQVSKEEGMLITMAFNDSFYHYMSNWDYRDPRIMEVKYEEFLKDPLQSLVDIISFLNLIDDNIHFQFLLKSRINRLMNFINVFNYFRFQNLSMNQEHLIKLYNSIKFEKLSKGRKRGEENLVSHYRKGVSGDWIKHFTPILKDRFKEKYGELLIYLGYEENLDW